MAQRYEMKEEPDYLWSIIDVFTGRPPTVDGFLMVGLTVEEAGDMLFILNDKDFVDRKAKGIA
jgi:hypothetical protein